MVDDEDRRKIARMIYESAEENAYHDDILMWEVTSIIWGANTLLLGFIIEAVRYAEARPIILVISVIGLLLSVFVAHFVHLLKIGQTLAYRKCRRIEAEFPAELQLHSLNHRVYEIPRFRRSFCGMVPGRAKTWVRVVSVVFVVGWLFTACWTIKLMAVGNKEALPSCERSASSNELCSLIQTERPEQR